jgi:8-oxo-dGTP diphosphatase
MDNPTPHAEKNPTKYVLGFAFSSTMRSIVLIEKKKPLWQVGLLNGIGGKIEEGETPLDAMIREFAEETGWAVLWEDWLLVEILHYQNGAVVYCYATRLSEDARVCSMEDERVDVYPVDGVTGSMLCELSWVSNLAWLVPKAYHQLREPPQERVIVRG